AELFISRAQAANANFDLSEQNAAAVAELCMRLEGLPLAIELAAARTKLLSPSTLLARLTNRLALLTGGRRDAPQHQQTLRMTFDWSYDRLGPSPQQLFARLSVFSGGWTLAAAEEICDATLEDLGTLVDESLVRRRDERFSMLEIVREYARERLGQDDDLRGRHLEYFVALAEEAEPELRGRDQPAWFARIEDELGNLRGEARANENVGLMALTADDIPEAVTWLTAAVELARAGGDDREIGAASRSLAAALLEVEKSDEAENLLEESLQVARRLGDAHGIAVSLETCAGLAATP